MIKSNTTLQLSNITFFLPGDCRPVLLTSSPLAVSDLAIATIWQTNYGYRVYNGYAICLSRPVGKKQLKTSGATCAVACKGRLRGRGLRRRGALELVASSPALWIAMAPGSTSATTSVGRWHGKEPTRSRWVAWLMGAPMRAAKLPRNAPSGPTRRSVIKHRGGPAPGGSRRRRTDTQQA